MESRRERAREQFPQVLLAVLGIIQALALELLWERGIAGLDRWEAIGAAMAGALQALAVFLGIVLLWLLFATMILRFQWVPRFGDLLSPFVLGGLEFMLIEWMAPEHLARWFFLLAVIFVVASFTTYATFRAAMTEEESDWTHAEHLLSYVPSVAIVVVLLGCAAAVRHSGPQAAGTATLLVANAGLLVQLLAVRVYWLRDVGEPAG